MSEENKRIRRVGRCWREGREIPISTRQYLKIFNKQIVLLLDTRNIKIHNNTFGRVKDIP